MITGIYDNWHFWQTPDNRFLLSDETTKKLRAFDDIDNCITWLYLNSHAHCARHLNAIKHGKA